MSDLVQGIEPFAAESRYHYHDYLEENTGEWILQNEALQSGERDFQGWLRGRREAYDALVKRWEEKGAGAQFSPKSDDGRVAEERGIREVPRKAARERLTSAQSAKRVDLPHGSIHLKDSGDLIPIATPAISANSLNRRQSWTVANFCRAHPLLAPPS